MPSLGLGALHMPCTVEVHSIHPTGFPTFGDLQEATNEKDESARTLAMLRLREMQQRNTLDAAVDTTAGMQMLRARKQSDHALIAATGLSAGRLTREQSAETGEPAGPA